MRSSVNQGHTFAQVPSAEIPRSQFNRSSRHKMTFNEKFLYPMFVDEVLPGDTFNLRTSAFCRMATPIYPIMDDMYMETFYFFVPIRLVWDNFQKSMGEQEAPGDSTDFLAPILTSPDPNGYGEGTLFDYMGLPTQKPNMQHISLPLRCYNLIWNEWFRDQNLQNPAPVPKDDGPDDGLGWVLLSRGKRHDYFTSCLPWPQKGEAVDIPIGQTAPIIPQDASATPLFKSADGTGWTGQLATNAASVSAQWDTAGIATEQVLWDQPRLLADLTNATAATINQLRIAFQVQKMYERDARGGTRFTELIWAHYKVRNPDMRLQRPEYLGGGSQRININPVVSNTDLTSVGGDDSGVIGRLSATGTASLNNHGFVKSFTEHGYIIGLVNVRADINYQQGLNRMWSRRDRLDWYWPALAHIGEQAVLNKEIFVSGDPVVDEEVFGYQERFGEYRYKPGQVTGQFRSNAATPLDAWHLAEDFLDTPTLGNQFIQDTPPMNRVVAVPSEPRFIGDFYHRLKCARPMPLFGVPGNIDRF